MSKLPKARGHNTPQHRTLIESVLNFVFNWRSGEAVLVSSQSILRLKEKPMTLINLASASNWHLTLITWSSFVNIPNLKLEFSQSRLEHSDAINWSLPTIFNLWHHPGRSPYDFVESKRPQSSCARYQPLRRIRNRISSILGPAMQPTIWTFTWQISRFFPTPEHYNPSPRTSFRGQPGVPLTLDASSTRPSAAAHISRIATPDSILDFNRIEPPVTSVYHCLGDDEDIWDQETVIPKSKGFPLTT